MPTLWRVCEKRWAETAFNGEGAARYPGRWNNGGRRAVYCAATRSLAALEILAHVEDRSLLAHASFVAIPIDVSDEQIQVLRKLPEDWGRIPPGETTRSLGERFLEAARHPALRVPSAVVPGEFNYLLNPLHPDFARLRIGKAEPFPFDPRLSACPKPSSGKTPPPLPAAEQQLAAKPPKSRKSGKGAPTPPPLPPATAKRPPEPGKPKTVSSHHSS